MKNILKRGLLTLITLTALAGCKKEEPVNANLDLLDKNFLVKSEVDDWLDLNFLNPYNIETKFRFDRYELALNKNITPPLESQVIPAMEMVRDVWIKPYEIAGGSTFIKRISPKQFVLAGSAEYNDNGSITLGTAEGGRKIVLYVINSFDKTNLASVKQMVQVIQHEYTHILNQTVDFQTDYQLITKGDYNSNWTLYSTATARTLGYITAYARQSPVEDFAEQSSNMLMMGRVPYNAIVNAQAADPMAKLKKKEQYVVDYFKSAFDIDFYQLQTEVQNALAKISPPVLAKLIGPGIGYTTIRSVPSEEPSQSPEFIALWNTAVPAVRAQGYLLKDITMTFKASNAMTLRYSFTNSAGTTTYYADADYTMTVSTSNVAKFTLLATQPTTATYSNMAFINNSMAGVNNYFKNNTFNIDWINQIIPGPIANVGSLGAFYKVGDNSSYFYGTMGQ